jgi:replicative DNA helicase
MSDEAPKGLAAYAGPSDEAIDQLQRECMHALCDCEMSVAAWRKRALARGEGHVLLDVIELETRREFARRRDESDLLGENPVELIPLSVAVGQALEEFQNPKLGIRAPFKSLEFFISGGFQPGELIYLGARPGAGKTSMALEIARAAAKAGKKVLIISREMLAAALARRMISQEGQIPAKEIKLGTADRAEVCEVGARLCDLPVWITHSARYLTDVRASYRAMKQGCDLLIVDYLQLIQAPREIRDRRIQVEHVSQGLKAMALQCRIPIVCLSSLSRPPSGTNPEPTLASLRESGELEHDADIVLFLHRELKNETTTKCIVAKNRDGATGASLLTFRPEVVSFFENWRGDD